MGSAYNQFFLPVCEPEELQEKFSRAVSSSEEWNRKSKVEISSKQFETHAMAREYLSEHTDKWDHFALAVKVGDFSLVIPKTKAYQKLKDDLQKVQEDLKALKTLTNKRLIEARNKKAFINCRDCGSKISSVYLKFNAEVCPICSSNQFLFTASEAKKIKSLTEKEMLLSSKKAQLMEDKQSCVGKSIGWIIGTWIPE